MGFFRFAMTISNDCHQDRGGRSEGLRAGRGGAVGAQKPRVILWKRLLLLHALCLDRDTSPGSFEFRPPSGALRILRQPELRHMGHPYHCFRVVFQNRTTASMSPTKHRASHHLLLLLNWVPARYIESKPIDSRSLHPTDQSQPENSD